MLEAIIAPSSAIGVVSAELPGTRAVDLNAGFALVPLVPEAVAALSPGDERVISLLVDSPLPERLTDFLRRASAIAPIAYVEAEFFGGVGQQGSVVWEGGEVVLGPLVDRAEPSPPTKLEAGPINRALRRLGVQRSPDDVDEFATLGLGKYRNTEDWLDQP